MPESRRRLQNSFLEHHPHRPRAMLHVVLAAFIVFIVICGIEGMQNGGLAPRTYARINDTFELGCYAPQAGGELDFYDDDDIVPESFLKRINESYVIYRNSCSKPTKKNITCKRKDAIRNRLDNVGMSEVFVDGEIAPVSDFKCRTTAFQNLTCTFRPPSSVFTHKYHLSYAKNNAKKMRKCKLDFNAQGGRFCRIGLVKERDAVTKATFSFTLRAENLFYEKTEKFEVELLETLVPRQLEDVFVRVSKPHHNSPSNASIVFTLPRELERASRDLMFDVRLKAKDESDAKWKSLTFFDYEQEIDEGETQGDGGGKAFYLLPLTNLEYANTVYQYKVRIKSKTSRDIDEMWSPYLNKTFKTLPKSPEVIAKVCENCFNVMDNGNIFLHWMEVPRFYRNGDNFAYLVHILNENSRLLYEERLEKPVLMIPSEVNATALTIHIYSSNAEGLSQQHSVAHVPIGERRDLLNIKKELVDDIGYKLSWKLDAVDAIDVSGFTVLYCRQRNELPNQCDSSIKYLELSSHQFEFVLNASHSHQFGVAVNRRRGGGVGEETVSAAGFQWARCTASKPDEIGVVRSMWSRYVTENSIALEWKLNCADKDIVLGYNVSYCIVADSDMNVCMENPPMRQVIYDDNHDNRNVYQIASLKPYRLYNISVALISTSERMGAFSPPLTVRTLEASPTAPRNLEALDISENSITLLWHRPLAVNGPSLTYQLWCNNMVIRIDNNQTMNETYRHTIVNLRAFTNYTVAVLACTRNCSDSSGSLYLRTAIGKPGRIEKFNLDKLNTGKYLLSWTEPEFWAGHLDYYSLNISDDNGISKLYIVNGRRTNCSIDSFNCDKSNFLLSMRAVNVRGVFKGIPSSDTDDCLRLEESRYGNRMGHFYGDSSATQPKMCRFDYESIITFIGNSSGAMIVTAIFLLIVLVLLAFCILRIYNKIQEMKDIHIIWPAGMEDDSFEKPECRNGNNNNSTNNNDDNFMKLDLVMSHSLNNNITYSLGDIKEESYRDLEIYDNALRANEVADEQKICHSIGDFARMPFISKSKTCEAILDGSVSGDKGTHSLPSSPHNAVDQSAGYTKMYSPARSNNSINNVAAAGYYCDMSGKLSPSHSSSINHSSEIKSFIRDSQLNNGYIQRKSIVKKPFSIVINSSGYVGLKNAKN